MQNNFYIQKGSEEAKDIFVEWGITVNAIRGLLDLPELKTPFTRNWIEEQGLDLYVPDKAIFADKEVEMDITYYGGYGREQFQKFISYLIQPNENQFMKENRDGVFQIFSSYRNTGARLLYKGMTFSKERYRGQCIRKDAIQATLKFMCPHGLSFGVSTYGKPTNSLTFTITKGESIDVFYSNGERDLKKTETFTKDSVRFCIINPSSINSVIVS
ncbi:MAG: hypothetical protein E6772_16265 [Dysgonomonas sp.]|nr:hypothetical protein [Dysgonomonas sp.]